jgi:glycerol-3-phosphate cytidylyltransferase
MKVGITFLTFDLFHVGHVKMLEEAKRQCNYLIVGLQLNPSIDRPKKYGPSQSIGKKVFWALICAFYFSPFCYS